MRITKRQLRRILREQLDDDPADAMGGSLDAPLMGDAVGSQHGGSSGIDDHHWPRVDWSNIGELVDKWIDMEEKSWDTADPSMNPDDIKNVEAKKTWDDQVENAALDMEAELTKRIRKVALSTMKEYTDLLIGGEYL